MPASKTLTPEQVKGSYEFKVLKRLLKDEFDYVTDVKIQDDKLNDYNLIFLDVIVDPFKMGETYDLRVWDGIFFTTLFSNRDFESPFPRVFFKGAPDNISRVIDGEFDDIIKSVRDSKIIPNNMKLPEPRSFKVGTWVIPQDMEIPKDYLKELITNHPYVIHSLRERGWGHLVDNL